MFCSWNRTSIKQIVSNLIDNSIKSISRKNDKKEGRFLIKFEKPKRKSDRLRETVQILQVAIEDNRVKSILPYNKHTLKRQKKG
jgi:signal transduction histidine kinase